MITTLDYVEDDLFEDVLNEAILDEVVIDEVVIDEVVLSKSNDYEGHLYSLLQLSGMVDDTHGKWYCRILSGSI